MTEHTPEPWDHFGPIIHRNGQHIAHVCADVIIGSGEMGTPEQRANTLLMTAAPALLKELKHLVRYFDQLTINDVAAAKAAIAKATTPFQGEVSNGKNNQDRQ
mgnify:CR=1 FL=1